MGLKKQVIKGMSWQAFAEIAAQIIRTITTIVLARILFPEDFGLVAMAGVFTGFASTINEIGLSAAIIQRKKVSEAQKSSAFWLNLGEGVVIFLIMAAISGFIARFYHEDVLKLIVIVSSTSFIISSLGTIHRALLMRKLLFKQLSIRNILGIFIYGASAISLGLIGYGYWSLIFAGLIGSLYSSMSLWFIIKWRPKLIFKWESIKQLMRFGFSYFGSKIFNYITTNVDNLLIGRLLGASSLGIYSISYRLALAPAQKVSSVISNVTFPAYSKIQDQKDRFLAAFLKVSRNIEFISYPLLFGLFATAPEFIKVVYSERWVEAIIPLQILCLAGAMKIIGTTYSSVLLAKGKTNLIFRISIFRTIFTLLAVFAGIKLGGIIGAAAAMSIIFFIFVLIFLFITTRLINMKLIQYATIVFPFVCASSIMAFAIFIFRFLNNNYFRLSDLAFLIISVIIGGLIYYLTIYILKRESIAEFFQIVRSVFSKRKS